MASRTWKMTKIGIDDKLVYKNSGVGIFVREIPNQVVTFFNLNQYNLDPEEVDEESAELIDPDKDPAGTFVYVIKNLITGVEMGVSRSLSDSLLIQQREIDSMKVVSEQLRKAKENKKEGIDTNVVDLSTRKH